MAEFEVGDLVVNCILVRVFLLIILLGLGLIY